VKLHSAVLPIAELHHTTVSMSLQSKDSKSNRCCLLWVSVPQDVTSVRCQI